MKTKRNIIRLIGKRDKHFRVSIFGSARIRKNDKIYKEIYYLARMLGEEGIDVVTGGGPGLMEAANSGHRAGSRKSKAHSIGLGIILPKEQKYNNSVDYQKTFSHFTGRLDRFTLLSNAVVVAPGGVGTMLELFYIWQLVQVKKISNIPIILLGTQWQGFTEWLEKWPLRKKYFTKDDLNILFLAKDSNEAVKIIDRAYCEYKTGNDEFCKNYKGYRIK